MSLWIGSALLTVVVLALMLPALWRPRQPKSEGGGHHDLTVYRSQLADLDRDVERGLLDDQSAHILRLEIQRRILEASARPVQDTAPPGRLWGSLTAVAVVLPLLGYGFYVLLGAPALPDQPYAQRANSIKATQAKVAKIRGMVDGLAQRLQENPNDGPGWAALGRSYRVLGEPDRARSAFEHALKLLPQDVQVHLEYASLLIEDLPNGALLPEPFVAVMRDVLAIDPEVPDALYFVGLAEAQQHRPDHARDLWTHLLKKLPAESPDRAELQKQIETLK